MSRLVRDLISPVMSGDPTALVIWGIALAAIIVFIVFLRRRLRLFDPLEPPREK
jgi:hypothetical protein